jgi:hypothetical protein
MGIKHSKVFVFGCQLFHGNISEKLKNKILMLNMVYASNDNAIM